MGKITLNWLTNWRDNKHDIYPVYKRAWQNRHLPHLYSCSFPQPSIMFSFFHQISSLALLIVLLLALIETCQSGPIIDKEPKYHRGITNAINGEIATTTNLLAIVTKSLLKHQFHKQLLKQQLHKQLLKQKLRKQLLKQRRSFNIKNMLKPL